MTVSLMLVEKTSLTYQQSQIQYEQTIAMNNYNFVTQQLDDVAKQAEKDGVDLDNCGEYKDLEAKQERYDAEKAVAESQLEIITQEIKSFDEALKTGIKNNCSFSLTT